MKKAIKGLFYLLNDISSAILKKTREDEHRKNQRLLFALIFVSLLLLLSLAINIYFLLQ